MNGIDNNNIIYSLKRLTNQIYKLLPMREEGEDWQTPLNTIIIELKGMMTLIPNCGNEIFELLCKLEGIKTLQDKEEFKLYRRMIFECLSIISEVSAKCRELKV